MWLWQLLNYIIYIYKMGKKLTEPKYSIESEQALLWAMLIDNKIVHDVCSQLKDEDFYITNHQIIYRAIYYLAKNNKDIDLITVKDQLEHMDTKIDNPKYKWQDDINPFIKSNELVAIWGMTSLVELTEATAHSWNYLSYIETILRYSQLRKIRKVAQLCETNIDNNLWPEEVIKLLESWIRNVTRWFTGGDIVWLDEILFKRMDELSEWLQENKTDKLITTWFNLLDNTIWPFMPGNLILVWARPAQWKTAFVMNIINNNLSKDKRIAFFSLEMNHKEIVNRFISMHTDIDSFKLKNWTNKPDYIDKDEFLKSRLKQLNHIEDNLASLLNKQLYIDDSTNLTPKKIKARLSRITMEEELDLIVIDYIWLMKSDVKWLNKTNETWDISRELKIIAWEFNCPVIVLSQLSREVETRWDKRPIMKDLRNSWDLEQDANIIMFLYRDRAYYPDSFDDTLQVIVSKNRDWGKWTIHLDFNLKKQLITSCSKEKIIQLKSL